MNPADGTPHMIGWSFPYSINMTFYHSCFCSFLWVI
jgi:hypothetical protein